jgi:O-antigen/teichoic acid export membrane protein
MVLLIILFYGIVALFQIPALIKKKHWRELMAFSFFLVLAFVLNLLQALDINIPNPAKGIQYVVEDVLHLKY